MVKLATELENAGYTAVNYHYPSTTAEIGELAEAAINDALSQCPADARIHFVTHSMGGILVRQYLKHNRIENLGRVVMLGPPNRGSQVVDKLANVPGFKLINGPAGMQLGTGEMSVPNSLGPANFELGVIAGTRSINLILSAMLPDVDDGKVTVENTRLEGMADHLTMPVTHPFMMKNNQVIKQVIYFLRHGAFARD
jgi:pimeloyl-ACP methyl ester carboxylesterase